jgi:Rod binding domain-containing protein
MSTAIDTSAFTQSAMWQAQNAYADSQAAHAAAQAQGPKINMAKAKEAAQKFEAFFVGQMMEYMMAGMKADETFGGGQAEDTWRSMLNQEYGKEIAKSGRLGIADKVLNSMIQSQERQSAAAAKLAGRQAPVPTANVNAVLPQATIAAGAAAKASKLDMSI